MSRIVSIREASQFYQVTEKTIYRWIETGKLTAEKDGRYWQITLPDDVQNIGGSDIPETVQKPNGHLLELMKQLRSENQHLGDQLSEKDKQIESQSQQIDHLTQVVAMSQKNIGALTEQLDDSRQMIEDMRQRKTVWQRLKAVFVTSTG